MMLNDAHKGIKKRRKLTRVGRGPGSGQGKTAGRGGKGQTARAGYKALSIFQGGASPLVRRIPKRGFTNVFGFDVAGVNVGDLESEFNAGDEVNPETVKAKHLTPTRFDIVKILGDGEITKALTVSAHRFSETAKAKIEKAGGKCVELAYRTPVAEKQKAAKAAKKAAKSAKSGG